MSTKLFLMPVLMIYFNNFSTIYDYSFVNIEGTTVSLTTYQQKKIIIVTLPIAQDPENVLYLQRLDSLSKANDSSVVMIGFPSYEDGYDDQNIDSLKEWYRSILDTQFVIGKGIYTHKTSPAQDPIFAWLTNKDLNQHFDEDIGGIGDQFFISENGDLYGVLGPEVKWSNNVFNLLIQ